MVRAPHDSISGIETGSCSKTPVGARRGKGYVVLKGTSNTFLQRCRSLAMVSAPHNSICGTETGSCSKTPVVVRTGTICPKVCGA